MSQATESSNIVIIPETAAALCEHPAVRNAIAYRLPGSETVEASIVANESYLDDVLGRKDAASSQVSTWRKTYDLSQLSKAAAASPFGFNIAGWNSSYTRRPLPPEDMQEWVQTTVDRISALAPTDVLEIGCGTGLLLLRLASACQRYVGMDFAPSVLRRLREQLAQADFSNKVELLERAADNFEGFADHSFSTVIVNSVAQYFPSQAYLNRVVENALRVVRPGGNVFIGDLRNFALLQARATSIEAFQAPPELTISELRTRIHKRLEQEQELLVSPTYFLSMPQRFPKIGRVEISPRRGNRDNEMTRFRFDAILSLGPQTGAALQIPFLDMRANGWGLEEIRSQLAARAEEALGFTRIPNSRVDKDIQLVKQLASTDPKQTIGELRQQVDQAELQGIHPEDLVPLAAETGYKVAMSWAGCHPDGSYDAAFLRQTSPDHEFFPAVQWPQPVPAAFVYFTNAPGQAEIRHRLVDELLSHCRARLQDDSVPANLHLVDSFPRTPDGSIDCDALLSATAATSSHEPSTRHLFLPPTA